MDRLLIMKTTVKDRSTSFNPKYAARKDLGGGVPLTPENSNTNQVQTTFEFQDTIDVDFDVDSNGFEYPEGGWEAWLVVFGSFLGIFPTWGLYFSAGIIQTYIASHQLSAVSTSTVSWIFSIYNFFVLSSSVFSGLYFDKNGARKPLVLGTLMYFAGMFSIGNCTNVWQFVLSLSIVTGISSGILTSPLLGVICHYFYKKRALATAVAINGGSIGGVIFPLMLRSLYTRVGFTWTMRIVAFMCGASLTLSIFLVKEDPSKRAQETEDEEQSKDASKLKKMAHYALSSFDYKALTEYKFLFCTIGSCFAELATGATLTYISSYCIDLHYDERDSFLIVTVLNTLSIVGGYFYSYIADRLIGRFNVMIIITALLGVVGLAMWLPFGHKSRPVMFAFSALYGFFYGSLLNLAPVCCGQISKTDEFGRRYSTMYVLVGSSFLIGIPISGAIIGTGTLANYNKFIIYVSVLALASSVFFFLSKSFAVHPHTPTSDDRTLFSLLRKSVVKRF